MSRFVPIVAVGRGHSTAATAEPCSPGTEIFSLSSMLMWATFTASVGAAVVDPRVATAMEIRALEFDEVGDEGFGGVAARVIARM